MHKILISGGTGFLGRHLSSHLVKNGYQVSILSRHNLGNSTFSWNVEKNHMDAEALNGVDTIIHLAGAGIADKRWTNSYKKEIIDSRASSAKLLLETLKKTSGQKVRTLISASGVGYYGESGKAWVDEMFRAKEDFVGSVCSAWEKSALEFESVGIRVVILRIGIVFAKDGGALPQIAKPIKLFVGAPLGDGQQYVSWIHIDDLCRLFTFATSNEKLHGVYNAASTSPVTNASLTKEIASALHRPVWPIKVPAFVLKAILGERASIVLDGQRVSSEKIRMAGFEFLHTDLSKSLKEILG